VSEPGVGDGYFAANAFEQSILPGVLRALEFLVDLAVHQRVDAADEEAGDAGDVADVLAFGGAGFERREKRLRHLLIGRLREEQGDIDVDPFFECLAYGGESFWCTGN